MTRTKELTDLGGDPSALRASLSTLSVLPLVNDPELEDGGGSIGVGCVLSRPGKGRDAAVDACGTRAERRDLRCAEERGKVFIREERRSAETSESQQDLFKTA